MLAGIEPKTGSLKGLVKAELHSSGSALEKQADGSWTYHYLIHVSLGGWLPTSLIEATMVSQMTGYITEWLNYTTKEYAPKD